MPGFPGAAYNLESLGDCASFQARACSRPPEPSSRTFMDDFPNDDRAPGENGLLATESPGEISGWKRAASGHCYLCLKDDKAVLDGVLWKATAAALAFRPEDGIEAVAT